MASSSRVPTASTPRLNGLDVAELEAYIDSVRRDPSAADRDPIAIGRWVGGTRAEVRTPSDAAPVYMGGEDDPSAMGMLVRALAACDIEVVATRAALLGIEIEDLRIEVRGHFNVARYLGVQTNQGAGLQRVSYVVHLKTREPLTPEQIAELREALAASPVGDTFERPVPVEFDVDLS